jgi:hypothetical protein
VKTAGFHPWKNVRRIFSTASEQAVENSLLHVRDDVPNAQRP